MWKVALVVATLASVARADDESLAAHETRVARDAATHGHCDVVASIGAQVSAADPDYYASVFVVDVTIAACMSPVPPEAPPPPNPALVATERSVTIHAVLAPAVPAGRPPLSGRRLVAEGLAGAGAGVVGMIAGGLVGAGIGSAENACHGEDGCFGQIIVGGVLGLNVGIATGVYAVGAHGNQTGSALATYGGALVPTIVGLRVAFWMPVRWVSFTERLAQLSLTAFPLAGAMAGFNLTRRYEHVTIAPVATANTIGLAGTF